MTNNKTLLGETLQKTTPHSVEGGYTELLGEDFYRIQHVDKMDPFFISLISSSDHWLFISTTGGLTAGRIDANRALFPYYTDDKVTESFEHTGSKTIFRVTRDEGASLWEPFSDRYIGVYELERSLYKNIAGSTLIFEEINWDLNLTFRYSWRTSEKFGFVKTSWLINHDLQACEVTLLDGLQNILPANVTSRMQNEFSNLLDAYKRSELDAANGLGIFSLSSTLTDLAEPSESLLANTVAQVGLEDANYLLSSIQLNAFRRGEPLSPETDICGWRGAFFVHSNLSVNPKEEKSWHFVAEVMQDSAAVVALQKQLGDWGKLIEALEVNIQENDDALQAFISASDGLQKTNDRLATSHHFGNVMFNIMRGGIFANQYWIDKDDFVNFIRIRANELLKTHSDFFEKLPEQILQPDLIERVEATGNPNMVRLGYCYLPLTFSRRHGDPSRPWNQFAINLKKKDSSQQLDFQGNWRDIFQNWEALALSYPQFVEGMIFNFLNATTIDGYNPYRISRDGIDWEKPEPENPWANIGYWSDHQIIYLLKLMEFSQEVHPGLLVSFLNRPVFGYANVPYRIKPYEAVLEDPYNSIDFDFELDNLIEKRTVARGSDGQLVINPDGQVYYASLSEKLLTLLLAKLVNFVPEGGIWMNTQRPEWNDANNALAGRGLSVVTAAYLRRFIVFMTGLLENLNEQMLPLTAEVAVLFQQIFETLDAFKPILDGNFDDHQRRQMMDRLGQAGSEFRTKYYERGISKEILEIPCSQIQEFLLVVQSFIEHTLKANRREDGLYHAYNVLQTGKDISTVNYLYEMLEGQVSILSSGLLSGEESLTLLRQLRKSSLYRADQHSYILYPDRTLTGFQGKNTISNELLEGIKLHQILTQAGDNNLFVKDLNGDFHFNGSFRNLKDVDRVLDELSKKSEFSDRISADSEQVRKVFEQTFRHNQFTGRSGTIFAYEGLGSIYWHMVSKLLLAVQETVVRCIDTPAARDLLEAYRDIRAGLGFEKPPAVYGAFPTDPYSHTPKGRGAKQPGMTGAVKEEILTRFADLGLIIANGQLQFEGFLVVREELLKEKSEFTYIDVKGEARSLSIPVDSFVYTICQVPILVQAGGAVGLTVVFADGAVQRFEGLILEQGLTQRIFSRDGTIREVVVNISK